MNRAVNKKDGITYESSDMDVVPCDSLDEEAEEAAKYILSPR